MSIYISEMQMKIPFFDCDPMGIVWHGNYVKYLEIARCDMFDKLGYNYLDMKTDGFAFPIAKIDMKFIKPAKFNMNIKIVVSIEDVEPSLNIKYQIFDTLNGQKIFSAKSMQICISLKSGESTYSVPIRLKELLHV